MSPGALASLLAFDTSTEQLSVALCCAAGSFSHNEPGGALASARLVPAVMQLLARGGLALQQLDAIAFGCGPGAFTGLRTSAAVAQGLALGAGLPVLALDSLMIVAEDARAQMAARLPTAGPAPRDAAAPLDIAVCMDARMDEVYAGHYRWEGERWLARTAPALYSLPALAALGWQAQLLCGSALTAFGERLPWADAASLRLASERDRAGAMLRVAAQQWRLGRALDAAQALPLYLRDKVASTTAERAAAKALKLEAEHALQAARLPS
jgi:tRNA threonylcarbamoyladenosine biosynthesis protein TsaB